MNSNQSTEYPKCTGFDPGILSRRQWLNRFGYGLGSMALAEMLGGGGLRAAEFTNR